MTQMEQTLRAALRGPKNQLTSWWKYILPAINRWHQEQQHNQSVQPVTKSIYYQSFFAASNYTPWTHWSLHPMTCLMLADLIRTEKLQKVFEFGSGYSTVFLTKFIQEVKANTQIESFEHQVGFSDRLLTTLSRINNKVANLHTTELVQFSDEDFEALFDDKTNAQQSLAEKTTPVPLSRYRETRLRNVFYQYDFSQIPNQSVDLIILDGPNGNGRSIAFPLMKHKLKSPSWILIDDYLDHPYLSDLEKVFNFEVVKESQLDDNEYILVKIMEPL